MVDNEFNLKLYSDNGWALCRNNFLTLETCHLEPEKNESRTDKTKKTSSTIDISSAYANSGETLSDNWWGKSCSTQSGKTGQMSRRGHHYCKDFYFKVEKIS